MGTTTLGARRSPKHPVWPRSEEDTRGGQNHIHTGALPTAASLARSLPRALEGDGAALDAEPPSLVVAPLYSGEERLL